MDYAYDIVLNFQPTYYEFYEWHKSDRIININKLPIYNISHKDYLNIKNNDLIIERSTLPKNSKIFLLTSGIEIIGISLNNDGKVLNKSSLLFEEADDILENQKNTKIIKIKYKICKKNPINYKSRINIERNYYINNFLSNLDKEKDKYFLKYLYYDLFTIDEKDTGKIYTALKEMAINEPTKLYDSIKKVNLELKK